MALPSHNSILRRVMSCSYVFSEQSTTSVREERHECRNMNALCGEAVCDCEMVCVALCNKISGVLYNVMYVLLQCRLVKNIMFVLRL